MLAFSLSENRDIFREHFTPNGSGAVTWSLSDIEWARKLETFLSLNFRKALPHFGAYLPLPECTLTSPYE